MLTSPVSSVAASSRLRLQSQRDAHVDANIDADAGGAPDLAIAIAIAIALATALALALAITLLALMDSISFYRQEPASNRVRAETLLFPASSAIIVGFQ